MTLCCKYFWRVCFVFRKNPYSFQKSIVWLDDILLPVAVLRSLPVFLRFEASTFSTLLDFMFSSSRSNSYSKSTGRFFRLLPKDIEDFLEARDAAAEPTFSMSCLSYCSIRSSSSISCSLISSISDSPNSSSESSKSSKSEPSSSSSLKSSATKFCLSGS